MGDVRHSEGSKGQQSVHVTHLMYLWKIGIMRQTKLIKVCKWRQAMKNDHNNINKDEERIGLCAQPIN